MLLVSFYSHISMIYQIVCSMNTTFNNLVCKCQYCIQINIKYIKHIKKSTVTWLWITNRQNFDCNIFEIDFPHQSISYQISSVRQTIIYSFFSVHFFIFIFEKIRILFTNLFRLISKMAVYFYSTLWHSQMCPIISLWFNINSCI